MFFLFLFLSGIGHPRRRGFCRRLQYEQGIRRQRLSVDKSPRKLSCGTGGGRGRPTQTDTTLSYLCFEMREGGASGDSEIENVGGLEPTDEMVGRKSQEKDVLNKGKHTCRYDLWLDWEMQEWTEELVEFKSAILSLFRDG